MDRSHDLGPNFFGDVVHGATTIFLPLSVAFEIVGCNLIGRNELVVLLFGELNFRSIEDELEKGDDVIGHELRRNRSASQKRILFTAPRHVLRRLYNTDLVHSAFGLNRQNEVLTLAINAYINLVDLDLR